MAISITSPQSRVVARAATLLIQWTSTYPYNAYEIQYRKASSTAWSTFGRVTSTETSASISLMGLEDGCEYHYRVVLYTTSATSGTNIYNGSQISMAYSLIVVPAAKLGTLKAKYGDKLVEVPVYADSNTQNELKVGVHGAQGHILVGSETDPSASALKVEYPVSTDKATLNEQATFQYSGSPSATYIRQDVRNTLYSCYQATKYNLTYRVGYYLTGYSQSTTTYTIGYYITGYSNQQYSYQQSGYYYGCQTYYQSHTVTCYVRYNRPGSEGGGIVYYSYRCSYNFPHPYNCKYTAGATAYGYRYMPTYSPYYGYYVYRIPNYNPYYNYYRYYAYYNHTYYTYTTSYHYV